MRTYDNGTSATVPPTPGSYLSDWTTLTQNASSTNATLGGKLINDAIRYLATKYYFNEKSYTVPGGTVALQQAYTLPSDFEQIENITVSVGGYLWQPKTSPSRKHFDLINLVPYYNDYAQFYFIWNGQINLWPIPASSSNAITINYRSRLVDMSQADVTTGTVSVTTATTTVTHSGTSFASWMAQSGWFKIAHSTTATSTNGDNRWYQIDSVTSTSVLELKNAYIGATVSGGTMLIGDVPILPEDYQDLPLYRALYIYFTSISPSTEQATLYQNLFAAGEVELDKKYGSKEYSPVLTDTDAPIYNPNLFPRNMS